jgi:uncharacterized protein GlcG (DUF336 family)
LQGWRDGGTLRRPARLGSSKPRSTPIEGGFPLLLDGKIVGAIGVSGANADEDALCAKAGADTLK